MFSNLFGNDNGSLQDSHRRVLLRLMKRLVRECSDEIQTIGGLFESFRDFEALCPALCQLAETRTALAAALQREPITSGREFAELLRTLSGRLTAAIACEHPEYHHARRAIVRTLQLVIEAETELAPLLREERERTPLRLVVPSELLHQVHQSLFPAERMVVVAGRQHSDCILLSAAFEVTGDQSAGHVRAHPGRLGQALIAMSHCTSHLVAWVHSHPGEGPPATRPSQIDDEQQQDWLRDYSANLLGVIMVADGWIRFWGPAVDQKRVQVEILGSGVTKRRSEHVYQLVRQ